MPIVEDVDFIREDTWTTANAATAPIKNPPSMAIITSCFTLLWYCVMPVLSSTVKHGTKKHMEITHLGHSSFKIRGKGATLVTDPYDSKSVGLKFPQTVADIVTISHPHPDHNYPAAISGDPVVVSGPGEYEIKGVRIFGISTFHDAQNGKERGRNTIYRIEMDGITLVHCGDLGHALEDQQKEALDDVDIVFVPVGGHYSLAPAAAATVITALEPSIVIPMHYHTPQLNQEAFGMLLPVAAFLKEIGKEAVVPQPKLVITKDKLPVEQTIIVLE